LFSHNSDQGYFRIVRRGRRWWVERDGLISGPFDTARSAAQALARGEVTLGETRVEADDLPDDLEHWRRGDLPPLWPNRLASGGDSGHAG
jgi:hypothetical protein